MLSIEFSDACTLVKLVCTSDKFAKFIFDIACEAKCVSVIPLFL